MLIVALIRYEREGRGSKEIKPLELKAVDFYLLLRHSVVQAQHQAEGMWLKFIV